MFGVIQQKIQLLRSLLSNYEGWKPYYRFVTVLRLYTSICQKIHAHSHAACCHYINRIPLNTMRP